MAPCEHGDVCSKYLKRHNVILSSDCPASCEHYQVASAYTECLQSYTIGYMEGYAYGSNASRQEIQAMVINLVNYQLAHKEWAFKLDAMPYDLFNQITGWAQ